MYLRRTIIVFMVIAFFNTYPYAIDSKPIYTVHTPNSILNKTEGHIIQFVGDRPRYSTCTSAAWFHGNYLAILSRLRRKLIIYTFDEATNTCTMAQEISMQDKAPQPPEHMAISDDETLLAVCYSRGHAACITIHTIDTDTHLINPVPVFSLPIYGFIHNVRFTHDGTYLAFASFDKSKSTCVYKIINNQGNFNLKRVFTMVNHFPLLKQKGINFTQDDKYAVLAYTLDITDSRNHPPQSLIAVHKFNTSNGTLGPTICTVKGDASPEDIAFLHNETAIVISDQAHDRLLIYPFDPKTGNVQPNYTVVQSPQAQLSCPHGLNVSQDGNYLAVTNYGDDTCKLYQIN